MILRMLVQLLVNSLTKSRDSVVLLELLMMSSTNLDLLPVIWIRSITNLMKFMALSAKLHPDEMMLKILLEMLKTSLKQV